MPAPCRPGAFFLSRGVTMPTHTTLGALACRRPRNREGHPSRTSLGRRVADLSRALAPCHERAPSGTPRRARSVACASDAPKWARTLPRNCSAAISDTLAGMSRCPVVSFRGTSVSFASSRRVSRKGPMPLCPGKEVTLGESSWRDGVGPATQPGEPLCMLRLLRRPFADAGEDSVPTAGNAWERGDDPGARGPSGVRHRRDGCMHADNWRGYGRR